MAFITVILEHFVNDITSTFGLVPIFFLSNVMDFQLLRHEKTGPILHPGNLENHDIIQETAGLGEIRGSLVAAAKRRCMGNVWEQSKHGS